jgi:hypothetical protein
MSLWIQNLIVFSATGGSLSFLIYQGVRHVSGKKSALGSCCAKGCGAAGAPPKPGVERVVFLPVEMLGRRK